MTSKRRSVKDGVQTRAKVRKHKRNSAQNFTSERWEELPKSVTLKRKSLPPAGLEFPTHRIWKTSSPFMIFQKFLPISLLGYVLNSRISENEEAFRFNKGGNRAWNVKATKNLTLSFFAAKVILHGWEIFFNGVDDRFKHAVEFLREYNPVVVSWWILGRLNPLFI